VDMTALSVKLQTAISAAIDGNSTDREHRNATVLEVQDVLRATADYVRAECDGDAELLTTSGFPLAKQPETYKEVGIPKNVRATATDVSGEVKLLWGLTVAARMFRIERAESDPTLGETTWVTIGQVSRQRFIVTGLTSYKSYWFRIVALGIDKEGLPSDVVLGRPA